jgi:hypothetical protein
MTGVTRTARLTGLAYLGLAVSGTLGFLLVQARLYAPGDAARTAANLVGHEALARFGSAAALATVLTQAATAVLFWRLFRPVHPVAAGSIAAFGLVNCVTILVGAMFSTTALDVALRGGPAAAEQALLLYELSAAASSLGGLFFGLWLMPMGRLAGRSGFMPRALGRLLVGGGAGYVLSVFVAVLAVGGPGLAYALTVPATAGELWMVGHLLVAGRGSFGAGSLGGGPVAAERCEPA